MESSKVQHNEKPSGFPPNQDRFVWNPYIAFIMEQNDVNMQLMAAVNRLEELCGKILHVVSNQQHVHRNRYIHLRDRIWEVHEKMRAASVRQDAIREELGKQGEAVFRLRKSFQNHRMSMREFTINQYDDLHDVLDMLDRISARSCENRGNAGESPWKIGSAGFPTTTGSRGSGKVDRKNFACKEKHRDTAFHLATKISYATNRRRWHNN